MDEGADSTANGGTLFNPALHAAADSDEARALLRRQARLVDLQIADLEREDKVRHWSLRVRHISDVLKLGFELAGAAILTAIAIFMAVAVWTAANDKGLVIDAFNVPADMASNGLSGQVIATQIQDRLAFMQAHTDTIRQANSYSNDFTNDIKVEIPDTGISIGEFYRYLARWLGHQTHISGEVWRRPGGLTLGVRSGADAASTFTGAPEGLPRLVNEAAERIYWQTQPYRYLVFLDENGRHAESIKFSKILAEQGEQGERAWAYARLALSAIEDGDPRNAIRYGHKAASLNRRLPLIWGNLAGAEAAFGHDEEVLQDNRRAVALMEDPATARQFAAYAIADDLRADHAMISESLGDYGDAVAQALRLKTQPVYSGSALAARMMVAADLPCEHDFAGPRVSRRDEVETFTALETSTFSTDYPPVPEYEHAAARGDWPAARDSLIPLLTLPVVAQGQPMHWALVVWVWPKLALADAMLGDFHDAEGLIRKTPRDCYLCMRVRGHIAAQERNWREAEADFAAAAKLAPSMPFAYLEWGEMLLRKGDLDGAIAKFSLAHEKGPHFADPLEMWGEALILQNRSDLALAKFEETATYAPNWGRLHLKWGEALLWSGDKTNAQKQFAAAAHLDLTPSEKDQLAKVSVHG